MSDHKIKLSCKGIGRITWLKVYSSINIESYIKNKHIKMIFNEDFSDKNIIYSDIIYEELHQNIITFSNIKERYNDKIKQTKDFLNKLTDDIESSLLIKLFLLKLYGKQFNIVISNNIDENLRTISQRDIPDLLNE